MIRIVPSQLAALRVAADQLSTNHAKVVEVAVPIDGPAAESRLSRHHVPAVAHFVRARSC
jgi:hypothetical protein